MFSCPTLNFCLLWHWHTILGTWVYHHENMYCVHLWSCNDIDHWPQGQIYRVYDMALCSGHSFLFFDVVILFGMTVWYDVSRTFMTSVWPWPLTSISIFYFHMNLSQARTSLHFDTGVTNFDISVYHHETTCCVHSWPLYDLDLWPICGWWGVSLVSFTHSFLFCFEYCKHFDKEVNVTRSEFSKPSSVSKTNTVLEFDFDLDFA